VQDQPVVRVAPLLARNEFCHVVLHAPRRCSEREAEAVRDAEDVRVDSKRRFLERDRHHDVCGLPADTGERLERLSFARHRTTMLSDKAARGIDDVFRLHAIEAARLDDLLDIRLIGKGKRLRIGVAGEERRGREVYPCVRALRRENDRDQQLERILVVEGGDRMRVGRREDREFGRRDGPGHFALRKGDRHGQIG